MSSLSVSLSTQPSEPEVQRGSHRSPTVDAHPSDAVEILVDSIGAVTVVARSAAVASDPKGKGSSPPRHSPIQPPSLHRGIWRGDHAFCLKRPTSSSAFGGVRESTSCATYFYSM